MKARHITIVQQDEGYLVTVGCQTVARESRFTLVAELDAYLADPEGYEKRYMAKHPELNGQGLAGLDGSSNSLAGEIGMESERSSNYAQTGASLPHRTR